MGARSGIVAAALLAVALPAATASPAAPAEEAARPRSVVVVTLDTTRADRLGCYGAAPSATPVLDALAAAGTRFEHVVSPAPLTVPAHASLFTGRVPRRHGARDNASFLLPDGTPTLARALRDAGYATAAVVGSFVLDRRTGLAQGFERYDDDVRVGDRSEFAYEERAAPAVTDRALETLARLAPPFLLWVHYFDPHAPYVPPEPFRSRHADDPYLGEIALVDREVGRLLEAVRTADPRALVAVVGDHGESLGEHGEATHGLFVYEATQRVPWILAGPGVPAGAVVRERVGLVDFAPTILEALGADGLHDADGTSVLPPPGARASAGRAASRTYEIETLFPWLSYGWAPLHALVRDGWKYIEAPRPEFFDLRSDPGETRDRLAAEPSRAAALARDLAARLARDTVDRAAETGPEAAERRRRLGSLGYVPGGPPRDAGGDDAIDPKDGVAWLADLDRARRLHADGRPAACVDALRPLLARNDRNVPALLTLASCRLAAGDPAGALAAAGSAEDVRPDDDLVAFHRANALAALADAGARPPDEARKAYERALALNPRRADAWLNYASFESRTAGPGAALAVLDRAAAGGVRGPDLDVTRGVQHLRLAQPAEAERAFRDALARDPDDDATLEAMARLRARAGDPAGAVPYLERLLVVAPRWEVARDLGDALDAAGDRDGAVRAWRRALALLPTGRPEADGLRRRIAGP